MLIIPFLGSGCPAGLRKMDWSLLLLFYCHLSIGRKTELALHCRVSHWYLPGLFPKRNLTDSSRYSREMESVIILFLLRYILKIVSTAEIRDSLKSVDISCTGHASYSKEECVWIILCPYTARNSACLNLTSLTVFTANRAQEENGASGQRKRAAGNQIWLQF